MDINELQQLVLDQRLEITNLKREIATIKIDNKQGFDSIKEELRNEMLYIMASSIENKVDDDSINTNLNNVSSQIKTL
jgi:hypothetical protein